jgi:hypothetical protein
MTAAQTLTATALATDGTGTNLTALLSAPTSTTLSFQNTLNTVLLVQPAASAETVTVNIEALIEGQSVSSFPAETLTSTDLYSFGPFHSVLDAPGGNTMQVTLSTTTNITVGLVTIPGVY